MIIFFEDNPIKIKIVDIRVPKDTRIKLLITPNLSKKNPKINLAKPLQNDTKETTVAAKAALIPIVSVIIGAL